jgi:predicted RecB family nuclease
MWAQSQNNANGSDLVEVVETSSASPAWLPDEPALSSVASDTRLWLTNDLLFNYQRCQRRAYLDIFGNWEHSDPPSDYLLKLRQDSYDHQRLVLGENPFDQARYAARDWVAGAAATLELMQQGVDRITRGVLLLPQEHPSENQVVLVSCPDLLIKEPGASYFGNWRYVPTEIKLGKRPKLDYQITAAFHAYVLAAVQGTWSETSYLILRHRGAYGVDLVELLPKMQTILNDCIDMMTAQQEPEVFIAHNRCDLCQWFSQCYDIAKGGATGDRHLSLLPGVTPNRYIHLQALQLTTVESVAAAHPHQLESLPGFGTHVAHKLIRQAQSALQNQALVKPFEPDVTPNPLLTADELPTAPVELYFDIEAAPEQNLIYLHGVLVVDRTTKTETFYPLLADHPDDEGKTWQRFIDLVWRYPTAPIFHFCPYEVQTVKRLANYYDTPAEQVEPLMSRFVDLHERVTRVATLPVESYALKPIARWLGFDWRDPEANGAQSIYWYAEWLSTGDRAFLDAILRYNEDDCRATYRVKDWLVGFVQREKRN